MLIRHVCCYRYPPASVESEINSVEWLEATFQELWPTLFDTEITEGTIDRGSFYASQVIPGKLRVISINSNFCNSLNWSVETQRRPNTIVHYYIFT